MTLLQHILKHRRPALSADSFFVLFSQLLVGWLAVAQWVKVEPATYTLSLPRIFELFFFFFRIYAPFAKRTQTAASLDEGTQSRQGEKLEWDIKKARGRERG